MKMIIVALALVAIAAAAPVQNDPPQIVRSSFEKDPQGGYAFSFEGDNGIIRDEQGEIKEILDEENKPHAVVVVRGSYTYPDEQGKPINVVYYADQNGYHAEGDSIPKLPARR